MRDIIAFFSTDGRIGVIRFAAIFFAAGAIFIFCLLALNTVDTALFPLIGAVAGATLAKMAAEGGRRLHDVGQGGAVGLIAGIIAVPIAIVLLMEIATGSAAIMLGAFGVLCLAAIFLRPGAKIANRFGDPAAGLFTVGTSAVSGGLRRVLLCTCLAITGGGAIGLTFKAISDGMLEERERRTRLQIGQAYPVLEPMARARRDGV